MSTYNYSTGDGLDVLEVTTPIGASEPVSVLDDAIRQIKAYLKDTTVGPQALVDALLPPGIGPFPWYKDTPPAGYLIANGDNKSRLDYPGLFALYGTDFGAGDGSTTFGLPDWRGMFMWFKKPAGNAVGDTGGEEEHVLLETELASHKHVGLKAKVCSKDNGDGLAPFFVETGTTEGMTVETLDSSETNTAGNGIAHNNLPPYMVCVPIIKAG